MNSLRDIINNLKKYATTVIPIQNNVKAITPLVPELRILEETDDDKDTPGSEIGVNVVSPQIKDTTECLKEFDDILEEINKDVTIAASLDDIDDVLKDMAQDPKDLRFEVPRFGLAEISGVFENFEDVDMTNSLMSLDDRIVSLTDIYMENSNEVINQDVISISSEDSQEVSTNNAIEKTSIERFEENEEHNECIKCEKLDSEYVYGETEQRIEKQTSPDVINEDDAKLNEHRDKTNEHEDKENDDSKNNSVDSFKEVNDITTKDVVFIDDPDDCGYKSSDFEFITEEEAKMDGLIINFKKNTHKRKVAKVNSVKTVDFCNAIKSPRRNKLKRKTRNIDEDPDWSPEYDSSSDDEVIPDYMVYLSSYCNTRSKNNMAGKNPDNEIILRGFMQENNPDSYNMILKTNEIKIVPELKIKTGPILNSPGKNNIDTETSLSQIPESNINSTENVFDPNNFNPGPSGRPESNIILENSTENVLNPNNFNPGPSGRPESNIILDNSTENVLDPNNFNPGPSGRPESNIILENSTENVLDPNNLNTGPSGRPETNIILENSTENVLDSNNLNRGPSGMQEIPELDKLSPEQSLKRNRSHVDDIEKWRNYQMRTRLNRPQFIVDYSYRDNHSIFEGQELYQLFDPNRAPLPSVRSIRLLEKKWTVCNPMLVEYRGVGFDVPRWGDSGSGDDEVKQEAMESAKKILEMYPIQNTNCRRF